MNTGLIAGYQSQSGKRLLFRSAYLPDGRVFGEILHRDEATGNIVRLFDKSKQIDPQTGRAFADLDAAGVPLLMLLKKSEQTTPGQSDEHKQLRKFLKSEDGSAVLDAVPALYAGLEALETDERLRKLKAPFGAIIMALQPSTQHYRGFADADRVLGPSRSQQLRNACVGGDCQFRGREFTIHSTGLFDVLSKQKTPLVGNIGQCGMSLPTQNAKQPGLANIVSRTGIATLSKSSDLNGTCDVQAQACFGACGPGCNPYGNAEVYLPACRGHDYCQCAYGYSACLFSTPAGCGEAQGESCASLIRAAASYFGANFESFFNDVWELISNFFDWLFFDNCVLCHIP